MRAAFCFSKYELVKNKICVQNLFTAVMVESRMCAYIKGGFLYDENPEIWRVLPDEELAYQAQITITIANAF